MTNFILRFCALSVVICGKVDSNNEWTKQLDGMVKTSVTSFCSLGALSIKKKKNPGLKFRKFHMPTGTVHSCCVDPTQATARLVIVPVSSIHKSGTGDNNFVKWKDISVRPTEITRPIKVDHL